MADERIIPNFFIVGAPKCGTTSMNSYLSDHPEIFMSPVKEPYYFGCDLEFAADWRIDNELSYLALFEDAGNAKCIGESSVWYLASSQASREIHEFNPAAKIIIMLRNPVDMMYSLHGQFLRSFNEDIEDFESALKAQDDRRAGLRIPKTAHFPQGLQYTEIATLTPQVKRFLDIFGTQRVHIILFDDLASDTDEVYRNALRFLGVDSTFTTDLSATNVAGSVYPRPLAKFLRQHPTLHALFQKTVPRNWRIGVGNRIKRLRRPLRREHPLDPDLRAGLLRQFATEIDRLGTIIERDLTHWHRHA